MNAPSSRRVGFLSSGPEIPRFRLGTQCSSRTRYDPWIYHEADPITSVATTNYSSSSLGFVDTLRQANFLTGGTLHAASLGLFVRAPSIVARRAKARWISWLGIVQATDGAGTDRIEIPVPRRFEYDAKAL